MPVDISSYCRLLGGHGYVLGINLRTAKTTKEFVLFHAETAQPRVQAVLKWADTKLGVQSSIDTGLDTTLLHPFPSMLLEGLRATSPGGLQLR